MCAFFFFAEEEEEEEESQVLPPSVNFAFLESFLREDGIARAPSELCACVYKIEYVKKVTSILIDLTSPFLIVGRAAGWCRLGLTASVGKGS